MEHSYLLAVRCSEASETFVADLVHNIEQSDPLAVRRSEAGETFLYISHH